VNAEMLHLYCIKEQSAGRGARYQIQMMKNKRMDEETKMGCEVRERGGMRIKRKDE